MNYAEQSMSWTARQGPIEGIKELQRTQLKICGHGMEDPVDRPL